MITNFSLILLWWLNDNSSLTSSSLCRSSSSCESLRERQLWAAIFDWGGHKCDQGGNQDTGALKVPWYFTNRENWPYSCHVFLYLGTGSAGLLSVFGCNLFCFRTRVMSRSMSIGSWNRKRHWNIITCSIDRWTHPSESLQYPKQNIRQSKYDCEFILCVISVVKIRPGYLIKTITISTLR